MKYHEIPLKEMNKIEVQNFGYTEAILNLLGTSLRTGPIRRVIVIDDKRGSEFFEVATRTLGIGRTRLKSLPDYAGALLQDVTIEQSGCEVGSEKFRLAMRESLGKLILKLIHERESLISGLNAGTYPSNN